MSAFTLTVLLDPSRDGDTDSPWPISPAGRTTKPAKLTASAAWRKIIDPLTLQVTTTQPGAPPRWPKLARPVLSKAWYGKGYPGKSRLSALTARCRWATALYVYDKYIPGRNTLPYLCILPWDAASARFIYRVTNPSTNFQLFQTRGIDDAFYTTCPDDIEQLKMLGFANINLYGSSDYSQEWNSTHRLKLQEKWCAKSGFTPG